MRATRQDAYDFFHAGALALADVEANGIRIDRPYLEQAIEETGRKIDRLTEKMRDDEIYRTWCKRYGSSTNLGSRAQLGTILFRVMAIRYPSGELPSGNKQIPCDEEVLEAVNLPFTRRFLKCEKLKKLKSTYLLGVLRECQGSYLHPFYNLHLVATFRSSSDHPNFQNIPIRDPELGRIIRQAFIPRAGRVLVECDLKGAEVCVAACYNKDPKLISYITDPKSDMHRDMAMQLFKLPQKSITKPLRQSAKNKFVFPQFYGDWYKSCAQYLWKEMGEETQQHLADHGIGELGECDPKSDPVRGTYEYHVQQVERDFWHRRFKVYTQWKKDWYAKYLERGYFDMKTGFRCEGVFSRKEVINYPVQGSAFHCLLWVLIELNRWLRKKGYKTVIVGQIHDSLLLDVVEAELEAVVRKVNQLISEELPRAWPWIIVPLTAEIEGSEENWFEKKPLAI